MKAIFLDLETLGVNVTTEALKQAHKDWDFYLQTTPDELLDRIQKAGILVTNKVVINRDAMHRTPSLKLICAIATGTDHIDLNAAKELGISVTNVTGYGTISVVQHVFALIFALTTNLIQYNNLVQSGAWQKADSFCLLDFPITELSGKTLGIIGYGELGQGVAKTAKALGMNVLIAQSHNKPATSDRVALNELLSCVDVLSLHVPLTENTRNLIGEKELASMKSDAILINCARGGIVNEEALAQALKQGKLGGAGVDVLTTEPPVKGNPLLDLLIPNLIVTPHIAWASRQARQRLLDDVAKTIQLFHSQGRIRNQVS